MKNLKWLASFGLLIGAVFNASAAQEGHLTPTASAGVVAPYTVEVQHTWDMSYEIRIMSTSDRRTIQTISLRNGVDLSEPDRIRFIDVNHDGYADLEVVGGSTDRGVWYKVWLFDPQRGQFIWLHTTENN